MVLDLHKCARSSHPPSQTPCMSETKSCSRSDLECVWREVECVRGRCVVEMDMITQAQTHARTRTRALTHSFARTHSLTHSLTHTHMLIKRKHALLKQQVVPKVRAFAKTKGFDFSPATMRWGVTKAHANQHSHAELCIKEIKQCLKLSGLLSVQFKFISSSKWPIDSKHPFASLSHSRHPIFFPKHAHTHAHLRTQFFLLFLCLHQR